MYFDQSAATSLTIGPVEYAVIKKTAVAVPTRYLGNLFIPMSSSTLN
jgi:hypothetical protein